MVYKHIVYASTHGAGDACPTPPDRSHGYVWGVFAGYDIYLATDAGKILKQLTNEPGYDAEATINWKTGTWCTPRWLRATWICGP
jgi:TolB protein